MTFLFCALSSLALWGCPEGTVKPEGEGVAEDDGDLDGDGYTEVEGDCDDGSDAVNPSAIEACNELDDDCDGGIDEGVEETSYEDADGDGYGAPLSARHDCEPPDGWVDNDEDCDDTDEATNPEASEVCEDGIDNDCDGTSNDCAPTSMGLGVADAKYIGQPRDYASWSLSGAGDVNGDGLGDLIIGAYGNGPDQEGAAYLVLGSVSVGDRDLIEADARYSGETTYGHAGTSVSSAGDVDGDGFEDLFVGAPGNLSYSEGPPGSAYLVLWSASVGDLGLSDADAEYLGEEDGDDAGYSLSAAGDVNGDGLGDLVVGAPENDDGGGGAGAAYLVLGGAPPGDLYLDDADAEYTGAAGSDEAGASVSDAGDVDGDGFGDLVVGAPESHDGGGGAAYLVLGSVSPGDLDLGDSDAQYTGERGLDAAGASVSGAGDVNGDGLGDLVVGAPYNNDDGHYAGAVYLVLGSVSPGDLDLGDADAQYTGEAADDTAGSAVSTAGDVDGDGFGDLVLGAPGHGDYAGAAYLVLGSASPGDLNLGDAAARYSAESPGDFVGVSVSEAGDVNGDGFGDLMVSAKFNDDGGSYAGAAYLVLGTGF